MALNWFFLKKDSNIQMTAKIISNMKVKIELLLITTLSIATISKLALYNYLQLFCTRFWFQIYNERTVCVQLPLMMFMMMQYIINSWTKNKNGFPLWIRAIFYLMHTRKQQRVAFLIIASFFFLKKNSSDSIQHFCHAFYYMIDLSTLLPLVFIFPTSI